MTATPPKLALALELADDVHLVVKFERQLMDGQVRFGPPMIVFERREFIEDVHITMHFEPNPRRGGNYTPHVTVKRSSSCRDREFLAALSPQQLESGLELVMESMASSVGESLVPVSPMSLEAEGWRVTAVLPKALYRWVRRHSEKRPRYVATIDSICALANHAIKHSFAPTMLSCIQIPILQCTLFRFEDNELRTGTLFRFSGCGALPSSHPFSKLSTSDGYGLICDLDGTTGAGMRQVIPESVFDEMSNKIESLVATCSSRPNFSPPDESERAAVLPILTICGHFFTILARIALGKEREESEVDIGMPPLLV